MTAYLYHASGEPEIRFLWRLGIVVGTMDKSVVLDRDEQVTVGQQITLVHPYGEKVPYRVEDADGTMALLRRLV